MIATCPRRGPTLRWVRAQVRLRRLGYRLAYRALALLWVVSGFRPDGVKCVIVDGESLLLVRHSYGSGGWDLPGGGRRRGEPPVGTARREMAEELGLALEDWRDLGQLRSRRGRHRIDVLGTESAGRALRADPVELADAGWFHRDRLPAPAAPLLGSILRGDGAAAFLRGDAADRARTRPSA